MARSRQSKISASRKPQKNSEGTITFTTRLTVEVQGVPYDKLMNFAPILPGKGSQQGGRVQKSGLLCPAKGRPCQYGLIDTFAVSEEIHHRFFEGYADVKLPHKFKIAVGGCPNNCVKPDLNDLGIIGQRMPQFDEDECMGCKKCSVANTCPMGAATVQDGLLNIDPALCNNCGRCVGKCHFDALSKGVDGYKIYIGGRWGKRVAQGRALGKVFTDREEALSVIEKAILFYREQGKTGERLRLPSTASVSRRWRRNYCRTRSWIGKTPFCPRICTKKAGRPANPPIDTHFLNFLNPSHFGSVSCIIKEEE